MPRRLSIRSGVGATALLRQTTPLVAKGLRNLRATIVLVRTGRKTVVGLGDAVTAHPGDVMLLAAGAVIDLLNEPGPEGTYEAVSVVLEAASDRSDPGARTVAGVEVLRSVEAGFQAAVLRAREVMLTTATPTPVARHAAAEVNTWLAVHGWRFSQDPTRTFADRLRMHVANRPEARWDTAAAAGVMTVSEATLRRRLAQCGVSLTELLRDVRLSHALTLLQASDDPVVQIALACGYGDHAHFSRRFRDRFGVTPRDFRAA